MQKRQFNTSKRRIDHIWKYWNREYLVEGMAREKVL
jgi:hypothetical protein